MCFCAVETAFFGTRGRQRGSVVVVLCALPIASFLARCSLAGVQQRIPWRSRQPQRTLFRPDPPLGRAHSKTARESQNGVTCHWFWLQAGGRGTRGSWPFSAVLTTRIQRKGQGPSHGARLRDLSGRTRRRGAGRAHAHPQLPLFGGVTKATRQRLKLLFRQGAPSRKGGNF